MKRKLWIAAALALFIAALYLGTAAADPGGNCGGAARPFSAGMHRFLRS